MVVAMSVVRMVQVPRHDVIDVIAVGRGREAAAGSVAVLRVVRTAVVLRRALGGVDAVDLDRALDDLRSLHLVQVPIVQIVDVILVPDCHVTTIRPVHVLVLLMNLALGHCVLLDAGCWKPPALSIKWDRPPWVLPDEVQTRPATRHLRGSSLGSTGLPPSGPPRTRQRTLVTLVPDGRPGLERIGSTDSAGMLLCCDHGLRWVNQGPAPVGRPLGGLRNDVDDLGRR